MNRTSHRVKSVIRFGHQLTFMEEFGDRTLFLRGQNILCDGTSHPTGIPWTMKLVFCLRIFLISYFVILKFGKITIFRPNFETVITAERALVLAGP